MDEDGIFEPNEAEEIILQLRNDEIDMTDAINPLLNASVSIASDEEIVPDEDGNCPAIAPLLYEKEDGTKAIVVLTSQHFAEDLAKRHPEHCYFMTVPLGWLISVSRAGYAYLFNPGSDYGLELPSEVADYIKERMETPETQ